MAQYIDKAALVAEIISLKTTYECGWNSAIEKILDCIDDLEVKEMDLNTEYIDLGLPSGTLWKSTNEYGFYTYDEAVEKFSNQLPSKEQWEELKDKCTWKWESKGYDIIGPNGKSIFLPAAGHRYDSEVYVVGTDGYYWSNTNYNKLNAWYITFYVERIYMTTYYRGISHSVRLVKH